MDRQAQTSVLLLRRRRSAGFTLIEMMVAIASSGLILVAASALMAMASDAVRANAVTDERLAEQMFVDQIGEELRGALPGTASVRGFEGSAKSIRFTTTHDGFSLGAHAQARAVTLSYQIQGPDGSAVLMRTESGDMAAASFEIFSAEEIAFAFVDSSGRPRATWMESGLPRAIKLLVRSPGADSPYPVLLPLTPDFRPAVSRQAGL